MQYLYNDGDLYYFMDLETYEQLPLNHEPGGGRHPLREGEHQCDRALLQGTVPSPWKRRTSSTLEVTDTEPGFKGDTASNTYQARYC